METLDHKAIRREIEASEKNPIRDWDAYSDFFEFTPENVRGKKILDVCSGRSRFSTDIMSMGGTVTEIDFYPRKKKGVSQIQAVAQTLPLRDNTFDYVISSYGIFWVETGKTQAVAEMLRVAVPGGEVMIHPIIVKNCDKGWLPFGVRLLNHGTWDTLAFRKDPDIHRTQKSREEHVEATLIAIQQEPLLNPLIDSFNGLMANRILQYPRD